MCKEQDYASSWCALSVDVFVGVVSSMCSATQAVKCGVASSSPSSLASVSYKFYFSTLCLDCPCCDIVSIRPIFPVAIFHMFSLNSHGSLGVVFTPPVAYSRPPSAVNDPTVTKQMNSGKSCLAEVSQLLIRLPWSISTGYVSMVTSVGMRSPTMILASTTKMKKNRFVSIVGFVELLLLSIAARETMLVWSQICAGWAWYRNQSCSNEFLMESNGGYDLYPQDHLFDDKDLHLDHFQSFDCGIFHLVWIYHGYPGSISSFAVLLELMGDAVLFVSWLLPVTVPVRSPFI